MMMEKDQKKMNDLAKEMVQIGESIFETFSTDDVGFINDERVYPVYATKFMDSLLEVAFKSPAYRGDLLSWMPKCALVKYDIKDYMNDKYVCGSDKLCFLQDAKLFIKDALKKAKNDFYEISLKIIYVGFHEPKDFVFRYDEKQDSYVDKDSVSYLTVEDCTQQILMN